MRIRWTRQAADDLNAIHQYLSESSPAAADKTIKHILSGIEVLQRYPQLGREGRIEDTRELVISGTAFIIFYRVRRDAIEILGALHGARKWPQGPAE